MSTAVPHYHGPSDISNDIHTSHRRTDGARRTCQAVYTISKDVCHSLMSLIGTVRWEGRFGASPTLPCQPVSLVLSRHGRTDVMAMKDALGGWSGGGPMHAQRSTPACWVAVPQCQPTNADSHQPPLSRTTLTTGPASLPTRLHGRHCRTPVPGPLPITADRTGAIHIIHQRHCALRRPFPANPLSQSVPPTWISTTAPGRRHCHLFL